MAQETIIAWAHSTWNLVWGCTKISPGCKNCYAETLSTRYGHGVWGPTAPRRTFGDKHWAEPLKWDRDAAEARERRRCFCGSMCDWAEDHPTVNAERQKLWGLIRATPNLDWLLLTKRADRIARLLPDDWGDGYPNVWLGVSIESNDYAWRGDLLREVPAVVRFVSYEPALGPLDDLVLQGLDWIVQGYESGPKFRTGDLQWARDLRDRCAAAGVAYFYKQSAGYRTEMGITLDGQMIRNYPKPRVRR